jgi:hypothetical protein
MKVHHHTILACGGVPVEIQEESGFRHTVYPLFFDFESCSHLDVYRKIEDWAGTYQRANYKEICCVLVRWDDGRWSVWCGQGKTFKVLN